MQLNKFTDYALRVLIYIAPSRDTPYTIAEIAQYLNISEHHLVKVVHFMAKQGWLITLRGRSGGIRLDPSILSLRLGDVINVLEQDSNLVNCTRPEPCRLLPQCGLKGILQHALAQFYTQLNQYTLADVLGMNSKAAQPLPIQLLSL